MGRKGCDLLITARSLKAPHGAWQKQTHESQRILEEALSSLKQFPKETASLQPLILATLMLAPHHYQRWGGKEGLHQRPSPLPSSTAWGSSLSQEVSWTWMRPQQPCPCGILSLAVILKHRGTRQTCVNIFCIKLMEYFLNEISEGDSKSTSQRAPLPIVCKWK